MTHVAKNYGQVTVIVGTGGELFLPAPRSLLRDFTAKAGDTITLTKRADGSLVARIYRRKKSGWVRLLVGGKTKVVKHPS